MSALLECHILELDGKPLGNASVGIQLIMLEGAKPPISCQGREQGWGGAVSPLPTSYGVWGSAVSSPSGVRGRAPAAKRFNCLMTSPGTLGGQVLGGGMAPSNPPMHTDDPKTVSLVLSIGRAEA